MKTLTGPYTQSAKGRDAILGEIRDNFQDVRANPSDASKHLKQAYDNFVKLVTLNPSDPDMAIMVPVIVEAFDVLGPEERYAMKSLKYIKQFARDQEELGNTGLINAVCAIAQHISVTHAQTSLEEFHLGEAQDYAELAMECAPKDVNEFGRYSIALEHTLRNVKYFRENLPPTNAPSKTGPDFGNN